ncbi:hypothetical protein ACJBU6_05297 [Exserohilum turcicum]
MPPYGLYPVPRHHLYDQSPPGKRPTFNSMDFLELLDEEPVATATNKEKLETAEERARRKQEKRERKEKKRQKKELREAKAVGKANDTEKKNPPLQADSTPVIPVKNGRYGPRGSYKKKEKDTNGKPVSATKRKRESDANASHDSATALNSDASLLSPNFLSGLKESMGDLGAAFKEPKSTESPTEPPRKKRGRPPGSRNSVKAESTTTVTPTPSKSTTKSTSGEVKPKTQKNEKGKDAGTTVGKPFKMLRTPIPVPSIASTLLSGPKKTPIPLPPKPSGSMSEPPPGRAKNIRTESQVLVTETPPSQMRRMPATTTRQPAIPFSLSQATPLSTQSTKMKKGPTIDVSSSDSPPSASEKPEESKKHIIGSQGSVNPLTSSQVNDFTSSNLMQYKQKLNDEPKPRPRSRRAVSEATSTTSSSSSTSMSIRDMLTRIPKPYTRPAVDKNPFAIDPSEKKAKKERTMETHDEASYTTFTAAYKASQHTINFTDEAEYLNEHITLLAASAAAGPLPCLNKATGCSPKSEQMLRLHREDNTTALKMVVTSESDAALSATHISRAQAADTLLRHSIAARIPVALGPLDGTWKLYCPDYTAAHVDKYGFGLRTLSIHSVAGLFKSKNTSAGGDDDVPMYTARLCIPPRPMAFSLAEFTAPPHASFRATTLKTVVEGYKMDVVFLGNGYLKLRIDVHLLLMGKAAAESGVGSTKANGKNKAKPPEYGIWDLLGVHDKAVVWQPPVDELEVEGRKLCAKYDG